MNFLALVSLVVQIVFIVLKLTDNLDWSWGWVLFPLIVYSMIYVFLLAVSSTKAGNLPQDESWTWRKKK